MPSPNEILYERVLMFMGAFSRLQFTIDSQLNRFLAQRMGNLGPVIGRYYVARIRDEQRLPCLLAMLDDVGYKRDLKAAKTMYERAKEVRDLVGHSHDVRLARFPGDPEWRVAIARAAGRTRGKVPLRLTSESFVRLRNDCQWLEQHVERAAFEGGIDPFMTIDGDIVEPPIPPDRPRDGEPLP